MSPYIVRRSSPLLALVAAVALVACEDARVKSVDSVGMTREQVITALAKDARGTGPDSMPNVYKRSEFLISGQKYEILYFTDDNAKANRDTVEYDDLTPIVLVDNRYVGKGWDFLDSLGQATKIPVPKRED